MDYKRQTGEPYSYWTDRSGMPDEVKTARKMEQVKRSSLANHEAIHRLRLAHPAEYHRYVTQERVRINQERGPLPGD